MTHTPGPWRADGTDVYASPDQVICTALRQYDNPDKETLRIRFANARLIAAAPALLEALEQATEYLLAHLPKGNIRDSFHELNEHACLCKAAHAAIALAKGQEVTT